MTLTYLKWKEVLGYEFLLLMEYVLAFTQLCAQPAQKDVM
jgi:hypothetical protein